MADQTGPRNPRGAAGAANAANAEDKEDPTLAQRAEKMAARGMRKYLGNGGMPTLPESVGAPGTMLRTALVQHDDHAREPSPMAMLAGKTRLAVGATNHVTQIGARSFSHEYLTAREDAKKREATTVRIPKADIADPATARQFQADIVHLARSEKTALDPKNPMSAEAIERKLQVAGKWPGANMAFLMENMGLARNPDVAKDLSEYARGGRERLVEAGLLPPLERDRPRQATRGDEGMPSEAPRLARGRLTADEAMSRGAEFRQAALPRPAPRPAPTRGGNEM